MVNMGNILLTKFIEKLVDVGFDYLKDLHGWRTGMETELQRLKDALPRILAVVSAAEAEPELLRRNPSLREWLWQLKDAAYEADDVLDELDYLRLQKQVEEANAKDQERQNLKVRVSNSLARSKNKAFEFGKRVCKSDPTLEKLKAVVEKMDGIAAHVGDFLAIFNTVQQHHQLHQAQVVNDRETGPLLPGGSNGVVGRDTEREELVQWLMKPSDEDGENSVPLFSVVGAGGMGKTTLSQSVFNDERVQKFFDLKIWVCVSTNFDARRLLAAVLESATKEEPKVKTIADLQIALKEKLVSSGKFLLVLDDAWNDDNRLGWDNLLAPLKWGKKGSKILLTTRSEGVAEMAALAATRGKKEVMKLAGFEDHVFIPLFYQYAFAGVKSDDYGKLQSIGKKIAKRLGGSPLAAKSIGALLNSKLDDQHWGNILQRSSILDAQPASQDNISSILMLSYHHLPAHLRSCFAFCSIFPQDYLIDKMTLIRMWVGAGLIPPSPQNQSETDEDTGRNYFDDLLKRSFFEHHQYLNGAYIMHDLLHELAQSVSQDECFRVVDDTSIQGIPTMVRHLWIEIDNPNLLIKVDKWKNLRTLVLISKEYDHHEHSMIFSEVFKSLKSIRVLHLLVRGMIELPDEIGQLIHLRVLSDRLHEVFTFSLIIIQLPSLICKLYHLQYIDLPEGLSGSGGIPQGMNNLISLKHMWPKRILDMIDGIGKLISLHELVFSIEDRSGRRIEELKDLNNLRELEIKGLENVKSHKEASMAELHNKGQLVNLDLEWGPSCSRDELVEREEILECLRPHSNLKELCVRGYRGGRLAKWMEYEFVNNLEKIDLLDLPRLECLPCLGKLRYLKCLGLYKIPKVKQLDCEGSFPRLEKLDIYWLDELEEWSGLVENLAQWRPRLQILTINGCPRLKLLPSLPLRLTHLYLEDVGLTTLPSFWPASNNDVSCSSSTESSSASLSTVRITNCEQLRSLARGLLQHHLPALEHLSICNCKELVDLPTEGLQHLSSLKTLKIKNCPKLQQALSIIPAVLPLSLRNLHIDGFVDLGQIVAGSTRHLDRLAVSKCPKLVEGTTAPSIKGESFTLTIDKLNVEDPFLLLTEPLRNLTSVQQLKIKDCSRLDTLDGQIDEWLLQNSVSLEYVSLQKAVSLQSLPPRIKDLSSLKRLWLQGLDKLPSLPQLPLSLQTLELRGCNDTLKERCQKDDGADWPNIKHIPRIYINDKFITTDVKYLNRLMLGKFMVL